MVFERPEKITTDFNQFNEQFDQYLNQVPQDTSIQLYRYTIVVDNINLVDEHRFDTWSTFDIFRELSIFAFETLECMSLQDVCHSCL